MQTKPLGLYAHRITGSRTDYRHFSQRCPAAVSKAVEKSRAAEAIQNLKVLRDQQALCRLAQEDETHCWQGENNNNLFTNINIEIKGTETPMCDYGTTVGPATKNFEYWADEYILAIRRPCDKYHFENNFLPRRWLYFRKYCRML